MPLPKVVPLPIVALTAADSIKQWAGRYLDAAIRGVRSAEVADKIALHLAGSATASTLPTPRAAVPPGPRPRSEP
jgi:hypothetical protein